MHRLIKYYPNPRSSSYIFRLIFFLKKLTLTLGLYHATRKVYNHEIRGIPYHPTPHKLSDKYALDHETNEAFQDKTT